MSRSLVRRAKDATTRMSKEIGLKNIHRSPKGSDVRKKAASYSRAVKGIVKRSLGRFKL